MAIFLIIMLILVVVAFIYSIRYDLNTVVRSTPDIQPPPVKTKPLSIKKVDIRLSIKSIIRWEQLRNKSFSLMDYTNKEDVETLLYTSCPSAKLYKLDIFRHVLLNDAIMKNMILSLERETSVLSQFQQKTEFNQDKIESNSGTISEIVSMLIIEGLDAHYVMEEMELCDLPLYINAYEQKKKEQMESSRLWTYFTILPHVDGKKLPTPKDLYLFPWEFEEETKEAERVLREDVNVFEQFMSNGKNILNKN